ncbi:MAG: hypothetical protein J3R72DRAFT_469981 [Linnemannia gamsii]|nr:MAG: hypothetical protein J3R72DRAFT_469981 [Linnemannia gamsii]
MKFSTLIALSVATAVAQAACPQKCPSVIDYVCGQNSQGIQHTFVNECAMTLKNCQISHEWTLISRGYCAGDLSKRGLFDGEILFPQPGCAQYCPDVLHPVCAKNKDGKEVTFANSCHLTTAVCEYPSMNWTQISSRTCSGDLN